MELCNYILFQSEVVKSQYFNFEYFRLHQTSSENIRGTFSEIWHFKG